MTDGKHAHIHFNVGYLGLDRSVQRNCRWRI